MKGEGDAVFRGATMRIFANLGNSTNEPKKAWEQKTPYRKSSHKRTLFYITACRQHAFRPVRERSEALGERMMTSKRLFKHNVACVDSFRKSIIVFCGAIFLAVGVAQT
jgi:hypothetical protein